MVTMHRGADPPPEIGQGYVVGWSPSDAGPLLDARDVAWRAAQVIEWGPRPYRTAFRALWTDQALVARFDASDPNPWHTLRDRDAHLWEEEVVEIFLDPGRRGADYAEVEVSPANVVCDLHVRTPWPALESDRTWHWRGLDSRVAGKNEGSGGDWIATVALPWAGLRSLSPDAARATPPAPGDRWRFNVFRIKRPHGPADTERDAVYAAWSVPAGPSFHDPAAFRDLLFDR